jgi:hypothetical protein
MIRLHSSETWKFSYHPAALKLAYSPSVYSPFPTHRPSQPGNICTLRTRLSCHHPDPNCWKDAPKPGAGCNVVIKRILWSKVKLDNEIPFRLMDGLDPGAERRCWIREQGSEGNIQDNYRLKVEIAQRQLGDLGREDHAEAENPLHSHLFFNRSRAGRKFTLCGGSGIRTHDGLLHTCFQDRRLRPLGHPSR